MGRVKSRPHLEVADIMRAHGDAYRAVYPLTFEQDAVMRHILQCRTSALGGHMDQCEACGHVRISYNSCRDRHCPKCQSLKRAQWLHERLGRLLPVPYFHVVFTLPSELNGVVFYNKRQTLDLLFSAASQTLHQLSKDPKHLGAEVGFTAVLHTWGQNLEFHPHLHCVVSAGGLARDRQKWIAAKENFFLPVKVMGKLFRGKFLHLLKESRKESKIHWVGKVAHLKEETQWKKLLASAYSKDWVVYAKPPFGNKEQVFKYLGRYTHRVAISNTRLISADSGRVVFKSKDYADNHRKKHLALTPVEFIRRFLLHVLPKGFVRIRHYGLCAGRNVEEKLANAKLLLGDDNRAAKPHNQTGIPWWEKLLILTGFDVMACTHCQTGRFSPCLSFPDDPAYRNTS